MQMYPDLNEIELDIETECAFQNGLTFGEDAVSEERESYTFETHPFYAQLGDFSNIDFPDNIEPAGELV